MKAGIMEPEKKPQPDATRNVTDEAVQGLAFLDYIRRVKQAYTVLHVIADNGIDVERTGQTAHAMASVKVEGTTNLEYIVALHTLLIESLKGAETIVEPLVQAFKTAVEEAKAVASAAGKHNC